ncbi:unnamed protein product [Rhizopus stolonifer]
MSFADAIECTIDFEGQKLVDKLIQILLIVTGIVSFTAGYTTESLPVLLIAFASGLGVTAMTVIPPWPMYNKNPQLFIQQDTKENNQ